MPAPQYEQAGADIGGTGTTNTIPRWTGVSTLGNSIITQDVANSRIGINTAAPVRTLHVVATTAASPARLQNTVGSFELGFDASGAYFQPNTANTGVWLYTQAGSFFGIDANGNIYGTSGTTGMTNGFFYIPAAAGAPTGTPTAVSGRVPMYYDTTNNNFYVYNGAWKKVLLA